MVHQATLNRMAVGATSWSRIHRILDQEVAPTATYFIRLVDFVMDVLAEQAQTWKGVRVDLIPPNNG